MLTTSTTTELPPVHERKRAPTHPGAIIKHECMEPLLLSVTALAKALGVSRKTGIEDRQRARRGDGGHGVTAVASLQDHTASVDRLAEGL